MSTPLLAAPKRQLVHLGQDEHVIAVVVARTVTHLAVDVVIVLTIVKGMLKRVAGIEGEATRKTLLHGGLQRVVFAVRILAVIIEALRPAVSKKIRLALILG